MKPEMAFHLPAHRYLSTYIFLVSELYTGDKMMIRETPSIEGADSESSLKNKLDNSRYVQILN